MNIHEYQAKQIFREIGVPVLPGGVATTADDAAEVAAKHVVITLRDRSLETIVVNHGGWVGKL